MNRLLLAVLLAAPLFTATLARAEDAPPAPAEKPGEKPEGKPGERKHNPGELVAKLKAADANGDGQITKEEFNAAFTENPERAAKLFERLDTDKNGIISKEEIEAWVAKMKEEGGKHRGGGDKPKA